MVQATLLFGAESWVMSSWVRRTLGRFHHRMALWLEKMYPNQTGSSRWIYMTLDEANKSVGMEEVEMYVLCLENNAAQYITAQPIMELCLATKRRLEEQVSMIR